MKRLYKSLIRENDEHWRDNLLGATLNQKLESAILEKHSWENARERLQTRMKQLDKKRHVKSLDLLPNVADNVFCATLDSKGKILDIGFNVAGDLIIDNFGVLLAGLIRSPVASQLYVMLNNVSGVARALYIYSKTSNGQANWTSGYGFEVTAGTRLQVGSSNAAAARNQYSIQTPFEAAPENGRFGSSTGVYGGGAVSFSGAVSAGGSGTVNETGFFGYWPYNLTSTCDEFMLFRDVLSSGVSFVAGNTLNVSYSINL